MATETFWCWKNVDGRLDVRLFNQRGEWKSTSAGKWVRVRLVEVKHEKAKCGEAKTLFGKTQTCNRVAGHSGAHNSRTCVWVKDEAAS